MEGKAGQNERGIEERDYQLIIRPSPIRDILHSEFIIYVFLCMAFFRNTLAVIAGYAIFVISALLLFNLANVNAHDDPSTGFMLLTMGYGLFFSLLGGFVAQIIARNSALIANYILSVIIAGFATFSLLNTAGNHYSQLAAIFLFAPASLLGGWVYLARKK